MVCGAPTSCSSGGRSAVHDDQRHPGLVGLDHRRVQLDGGGAAGGDDDRRAPGRQADARARRSPAARSSWWTWTRSCGRRRRAPARAASTANPGDDRVGDAAASPLVDERGAERRGHVLRRAARSSRRQSTPLRRDAARTADREGRRRWPRRRARPRLHPDRAILGRSPPTSRTTTRSCAVDAPRPRPIGDVRAGLAPAALLADDRRPGDLRRLLDRARRVRLHVALAPPRRRRAARAPRRTARHRMPPASRPRGHDTTSPTRSRLTAPSVPSGARLSRSRGLRPDPAVLAPDDRTRRPCWPRPSSGVGSMRPATVGPQTCEPTSGTVARSVGQAGGGPPTSGTRWAGGWRCTSRCAIRAGHARSCWSARPRSPTHRAGRSSRRPTRRWPAAEDDGVDAFLDDWLAHRCSPDCRRTPPASSDRHAEHGRRTGLVACGLPAPATQEPLLWQRSAALTDAGARRGRRARRASSRALGERLAARDRAPTRRLELVAGAGHAAHLEQPGVLTSSAPGSPPARRPSAWSSSIGQLPPE